MFGCYNLETQGGAVNLSSTVIPYKWRPLFQMTIYVPNNSLYHIHICTHESVCVNNLTASIGQN